MRKLLKAKNLVSNYKSLIRPKASLEFSEVLEYNQDSINTLQNLKLRVPQNQSALTDLAADYAKLQVLAIAHNANQIQVRNSMRKLIQCKIVTNALCFAISALKGKILLIVMNAVCGLIQWPQYRAIEFNVLASPFFQSLGMQADCK